MFLNNFKINIRVISECFIGFKHQGKLSICKVENIICCKDSKNILLVKYFEKIEPFFNKPINSMMLGIAQVFTLSNNYDCVNVCEQNIKKYVVLKYANNIQIAFPILHYNSDF